MTKQMMLEAFSALDGMLNEPLEMLIGEGAAMLLAHSIPVSTLDVDGMPLYGKISPSQLDPIIKTVGRQMGIGAHWYNDYFNTFTFTLPKDFRDRLVTVFNGDNLVVKALGPEDLLIMKCFAGREKDIGHAKVLIKQGLDLNIVEEQLQLLADKGLPGSEAAIEFFDEVIDQMEG